MHKFKHALLVAALSGTALIAPVTAAAQDAAEVVMAADTQGTPDERAAQVLAQMTLAEKLSVMMGYFGESFPPTGYAMVDGARPGSAGYVPGVPRLGIPAQWQTDAGMGVASQGLAQNKRGRTALPSGLAVAATWSPEIAYAGGAMIGSEARADGFNVLLGGSVNLLREPRNGRNFEYAGEDPLLAGTIVGGAIAGVQSNDIIATTKHYAVNDQETARFTSNSVLDEAAMRESDLLAFQFAFESGRPGSAMCAYNRVGGIYACEHPFLLTEVLRDEWGWPGYVLSDWGAVHSTAPSLLAGLDQESGFGLQNDGWFAAERLEEALAAGQIDETHIDVAVSRILRTMFAHGLMDNPVEAGGTIDFAANQAVTQAAAEAGIVLLRNEGDVLPLAARARRIAVIGGHADRGVLSGGGSSQVYPGDGPDGGNAVPGAEPATWPGPVVYYPSSPVEELRALLPEAQIDFVQGDDVSEAIALAAAADVTIVFGTQWSSESIDVPMALDGQQDALIAMLSGVSDHVVVVLETNSAVAMPWADHVEGVLAAWYPGRMGGAAIARVLTGAVNPSGHSPITWPHSLEQMPWSGEARTEDVVYDEGAAVGYKWFDREGLEPLFPFGQGLSYTEFEYSGLDAGAYDQGLSAELTLTNTGERAGADVVQVYVEGEGWEAPRRLAGYARVELEPGASASMAIRIDPRLLAVWDSENPGWNRAEGTYTVSVGHSSRDMDGSVAVELPSLHLPPQWRPQEGH